MLGFILRHCAVPWCQDRELQIRKLLIQVESVNVDVLNRVLDETRPDPGDQL